jgi:zinc D-Ala-D-Ala carboxypeptidase
VYNILVIKNNIGVSIDDDLAKAEEYFSTRLPFKFKITVAYTDFTNIQHTLFKDDGTTKWYGTTGVKELIRQKFGEKYLSQFDAVEFYYDVTKTESYQVSLMVNNVRYNMMYVTSWTFWEGMRIANSQYSEIITNTENDKSGWIWKTIVHERMHQFCNHLKKYGVIDYMDATPVNGKMVAYHKNEDPYATDGNHAATFKEINPYISNIIETKPMYKYFTEKEIKGLESKLVKVLDNARGIANTPFIISSGFRTAIDNKRVGGVPNSSHLKGLAVDLVCTDNAKRTKILRALYSCGVPLFIEVARKHIHVDIDSAIHQLDTTMWGDDD